MTENYKVMVFTIKYFLFSLKNRQMNKISRLFQDARKFQFTIKNIFIVNNFILLPNIWTTGNEMASTETELTQLKICYKNLYIFQKTTFINYASVFGGFFWIKKKLHQSIFVSLFCEIL